MEIEIPDLEDVKFVEFNWATGKYRLSPVGERLVDFLRSLGVPMVTPNGYQAPESQ